MKKLLVTSLAIAVLGISFCAVVDVPILHKHAEAAVQMIAQTCGGGCADDSLAV